MPIFKSFKYRLYPSAEQEVLLSKHFGAVRFIYNLALETRNYAYKSGGVRLSAYELMKQTTDLKKDCPWLYEVSVHTCGKYQPPKEDKGVQTEGKSEDPLSDFTIPEFADAHYIKLYDAIGPKYFCKGSDDQLRKWGNSEDDIMKIKIDCVKDTLQFYKAGIVFYMMLCEIRG